MTASQDSYRTGWDPNESGLSPASVTSADFGQQFSTALDGQVYAQPLVVGNTLIAATENDKVYGLNASTGAILWTKDVGPFWPAATIGCSDLTPNLGITSTPVYDPSTGYVYLVAKANDGADAMHPHYYMHAVNPSTGAEKSGFPVAIGGHPSNDPTATFDPYSQGQRPGLLLVGGVVYAGFGSHCDYGTYHGYVAGVSTSGHQTALWSDETGAGNNGGGIWAGGGGLTSDGAGQIIVASGNGVSPAPGPGKTPPGNLAESVIRLSVNADGSLSPTDFFSPHDAPTMDANDTDFGAGGPMALPDSFGTAVHPHLLVQMGKDGRLFLLDRDNLGGRTSSTTGDPNALSMTGPYQGQWGHPAAWGGDGGYAYLVGNGGPLRAFKYGVTGSGVPALTLAGASVGTFPYTSGSPVVTSSGTTSGSAVVWTAWSSGPTGANAELRAYNAVPDASGNLTQLWSAPIGTAVKFTTPATNGGRVYVGTRDGKILAFGRPATSVLTGAPLSIGDVAVGATRSGTLAVTASSAISVTGVTSTSPFAATPPALPYPLAAGATLNLPVSFTPGAAGTQSGTVTVATDHGSVAFTVSGNGTKPGFGAVPPSATFADQPVGLSSTKNIQVTNTGTSPETISAVSTPSAPYTVSGLPAIGAAIPAGGSFIASVTYAPTTTSTDTGAITVTSTSGTETIPISGNAIVGQGHLDIAPWPVDFGTVPFGSTTTKTFTITNTGNIPVTVTKAKAPDSDYTSSSPLPEGQVIGPGQVYVQSVTLNPTAVGTDAGSYEMTSDDGQSARLVPLTAKVVATLPAVGTDWQVNGSAAQDAAGGTITLTSAGQFLAGSAFSTFPVATAGLAASFTTQIGGGTGADGMTFGLLDSSSTPFGVGGNGGGLGFGGMPGICVAFDTFQRNVVGIATGADAGGGALTYLATATVPTDLRTGTHKVTVTVLGNVITVYVDGAKLLSYAAAAGVIPAHAYAGFTGGTGANTDGHAVSGILIAPAPPVAAVPPTANPATVTFPQALLGFHETQDVTLTNPGPAPVVITAVTGPTGAFAATVLPPTGLVLPAGASTLLRVTFAPTSYDAPTSGSLVVATTAGNVTVPVSGSIWPKFGSGNRPVARIGTPPARLH